MKEWGRMIPTYRAGMKHCLVCGNRDNCSTWEYRRGAIFCRRVPSEHPGSGGWTHILDEEAPRPVLHHVKPEPRLAPMDRGKCDLVYQFVLRSLHLFTPHREDLIRRGLNELAIARGRFKSVPTEEEAERIVKMLLEETDLAGVPGFYKDRSRWKLVKTPSGFFVPVLDRQGLIQGLQIRRDYLRHPKDPRYTWFSSNPDYFPHGTKSGAPVHVQNPERMSTGRCIIIEGALKAFITAQYLSPDEGGLLAVSGTSCFKENFGAQIKSVWPELHTAIVCFDADWKTKSEVKGALRRLVRSLKSASFESVIVRSWDYSQGKGIDDVLTSESYEVAEVAVA
jgi:hypothetical protein